MIWKFKSVGKKRRKKAACSLWTLKTKKSGALAVVPEGFQFILLISNSFGELSVRFTYPLLFSSFVSVSLPPWKILLFVYNPEF